MLSKFGRRAAIINSHRCSRNRQRHMASAAFIKPGLERISRLLERVQTPWRAIHVAGTNGKGSICAYLDAMLGEAEIPTGRFTSPHMIDRWDCIQLNQKPVPEALFREVEDAVLRRDKKASISASPFEILTAVAFEIFTREKVAVGVVECGMGGRLDATNVLVNPLVTVISRIGLDHQAFLGHTYAEIAAEKAGIMKPGTPCVVQSHSPREALAAIKGIARSKNIELHLSPNSDGSRENDGTRPYMDLFGLIGVDQSNLAANQAQNMWCALRALQVCAPALDLSEAEVEKLATVMPSISMPGRLQLVDISSVVPARTDPIVLDGAHNEDAFRDLVAYCERLRRPGREQITWLVALSGDKSPAQLLGMLPKTDKVVAVEFGPVDGMPWVKPVPMQAYKDEEVFGIGIETLQMGEDLTEALRTASDIAQGGPVVVCGSLYLASDVLRMVRK